MTAIGLDETGAAAAPGRFAGFLDEVREQEAFRWVPVFLVIGVWIYFALPREPALLISALAGACALLLLRMGKAARLVAALLLGFVLVKARAELAGTQPLDRTLVWARVVGVVEDVERRGAKRARLRLRVESIEGIEESALPRRLLLSMRGKHDLPPIGARIAARAMLTPLPVPVVPAGFDYGRSLWFEGIGGTGRIAGRFEVETRPLTWSESIAARLAELRAGIGERIRAIVPRELAGFAEALITGERGFIPRSVNDSLQVSGLAHVLSISGLHMSLVAGGVFWLVRAILALFPALALRRPIKKWAALAALGVGLFYMLLAGADVATQRSYLMLAVMFLAVLLDRPAISLRNLCLAALIVLMLQPEAAVTASFQMSFLAVAGLVALSEAVANWRQSRAERRERGVAYRILEYALLAVVISGATTLVAGSLSSIPAAYHFGRLAPLSLFSNLLALPVFSLVVMPMAVLAVLLMPFGLEAAPLWLMGEGLRLVMAISDWVVSMPGAQFTMAAPPKAAILLIAGGALWICFWRGRLRPWGLTAVALGVVLAPFADRADIIVEETAANVAVRGGDGRLVLADPRKGRFAAERWLTANGDGTKPAEAARRPGWICEGSICRAIVAGKRVTFVRGGSLPPNEHCDGADILIAAMPLRGACRSVGLRIDRFAVWRHGAHAITVSDDRLTVRTSRGEQGVRPWTVKRRARLVLGGRPPLLKPQRGLTAVDD